MRCFLILLFATPWAIGCAQQNPPLNAAVPGQPAPIVDEAQDPNKVSPGEAKPIPREIPAVDPMLPLARIDEYEDQLIEAFKLLSDDKEEEALAALQHAQTLQDTPFVQREIARLQEHIARHTAADRMAQEIQLVLTAGRADEASRLSSEALGQYGDTEVAPLLTRLKRQADAILDIQTNNKSTRLKQCIAEANTALQAKNLRAAVVGYEQAIQHGGDETIQQRLTDIRTALRNYDANRERAIELRRNPDSLEDSLAAYQEAAKAWDTVQIRQDIEQVQELISHRRPRLAIADFEVRGDVAAVIDGETVAEELMDDFKARFDLVEHAQFQSIIKELQIDSTASQVNQDGHPEIARLSKARFLVVGSISRLGGLVLHARLIDLRTGLVVQTAKIVAPTPADLIARLPQAARMLQMSDVEKIAYEQQLNRDAAIVQPVVLVDPQPLPEAVVVPPAPIIIHSARVPELGGFDYADFRQLPQEQAKIVLIRQDPVRDRAFQVALEVGDNLFHRGQFVDAHRQFQFALALAPNRQEVRLRVDRCQPHLPVVIVVPVKPRLAVLNFIEIGNPQVIPPGLGAWTADQISPHFAAQFDVVDRGEVYWWMNRLGLSMRDLVLNSSARLVLARAMNVRFFLLGTLRETASFNVDTQLIDAEFNYRVGYTQVHVHNVPELKFRLGEIARLTLLTPAERQQMEQEAQQYETLLTTARIGVQKNQFAIAITSYDDALRLRPNSVEIRLLLAQTRTQQKAWEWEESRRIAFEQHRQRQIEVQRQQLLLAAQAEQIRQAAEREDALIAQAQRQRLIEQQQQARQQLLVQARFAVQNKNFAVSINFYESALSMNRSDDITRELIAVRAQANLAEQQRIQQEQAARALAIQQQREQEIARAKQALIDQQAREHRELELRQQASRQQQDGEFTRLIAQSKADTAAGRFVEAVARLQNAKSIRPTREVETLLNAALIAQARAQAERVGEQARQDLERQLAQERERRVQAEADADRIRQKYQQALVVARRHVAEKNYQLAVAQYQQTLLIQQTDEAAKELKQARDMLTASNAEADRERKARIASEQKLAQIQSYLTEARAQKSRNQFDQSATTYRTVLKMAPDNRDAIAELTQVEQQRDDFNLKQRRGQEDESFRKLFASANAHLAAKRYDAAVANLTEALKLRPTDSSAQLALRQAQQGQAAMQRNEQAQAEAAKKLLAYQDRMREGRVAFNTKRYDAALTAFKSALELSPGDQAAQQFIDDVNKATKQLDADRIARIQMEEQQRQKSQQLQQLLQQAKLSIASKRFDAASQALASASKLDPNNPDVKRLTAQVDAAREQDRLQNAAMQQDQQLRQYVAQARTAITSKQFPQANLLILQAKKLDPKSPLIPPVEAELVAAQKPMPMPNNGVAYDTILKAGREALIGKRFDAATKFLSEASRLMPTEAEPKRLLLEVERTKQADFAAKLGVARTAFIAKRYDDAIRAGNEALQILPDDADAKRIVTDSMRMNTPIPMPKVIPKVDPTAEFNKLIQKAAASEAQGDYQSALKGYEAALKLVNDANAKKKLDFCSLMVQGYADLGAKRWDAAAAKFNTAVRMFPNDVNAKAGLTRAQQKK